ncbi:unnamed protein product [Eruca vesicaria subsp. sativa]|uniref:DNA polymerase epsilon catalytic subunit n=1 Tax=Eruca vesicaria subsp. sativa TaxID=29727 RepID=A0ABC8LSK3_ERUVS|nr:unnamed protein product [Eruca vesicaria subsp. sativa]
MENSRESVSTRFFLMAGLVEIQEQQFRKESKKLEALLADPEIEGIYETKVPLEFSAICQIGCVCKMDGWMESW